MGSDSEFVRKYGLVALWDLFAVALLLLLIGYSFANMPRSSEILRMNSPALSNVAGGSSGGGGISAGSSTSWFGLGSSTSSGTT